MILFSADVERACAFYRRLGFRETFRVPRDGPPIHADLVLDGYKIGVASIASSREHHGLAEPQVWLYHLLIASVEDPDDHPVQLVQELADG